MLLSHDLLTLSDLCSFWGLLTKYILSGLCFQQYNLGMGKVGEGGRGRNEGYGSGWSWRTCQLHTWKISCQTSTNLMTVIGQLVVCSLVGAIEIHCAHYCE